MNAHELVLQVGNAILQAFAFLDVEKGLRQAFHFIQDAYALWLQVSEQG